MTSIQQPDSSYSHLAPGFGLALRLGIRDCNKHGLRVGLHEGGRSDERQKYLYAQGRSRSGGIVTHAKTAKNSWHGFFLAGDVVFQTTNMAWTWDVAESDWRAMKEIMEKYGLTTGLDWQSPPDGPHVQPTNLKKRPSSQASQLADQGLPVLWEFVGWLYLKQEHVQLVQL